MMGKVWKKHNDGENNVNKEGKHQRTLEKATKGGNGREEEQQRARGTASGWRAHVRAVLCRHRIRGPWP